ncbi:MAG: hypothetical protein KAX38_03725, partial [Candidatus Krumholzibacteria bacterium]|nr:hypothetical protein [Candidatus Krumholzibacteria bacterium]
LPSLNESPAISDIQFASSIEETEENLKFVKGNLQVVPYPLHIYRIPFPLLLYFEIYGLDTDNKGLAFYTVEYSIVPLKKRRKGPVLEDIPPAIISRFEATSYGPRQAQRISIATENLWEGPFKLIVSVMDRRTLKESKKTANFSILD